ALQNGTHTIVTSQENLGYIFTPTIGPAIFSGGPNVTRGLIFIPEQCVRPSAYAPFLVHFNLGGHLTSVVLTKGGEDETFSRIMKIMTQYASQIQYWAIGGHGRGGRWASKIARALHPKVKGLFLLGAVPDSAVNFKGLNIEI